MSDNAYVDQGTWDIAVEHDLVDVRMTSPELEVPVENKIQGETVKPHQLRDYYLTIRPRTPPNRRLAAVYVAPKGIAGGQMHELRLALLPGDTAGIMSWGRDLDELVADIDDPSGSWFARSRLKAIHRAIGQRRGDPKADQRFPRR